MIKQITAAVLLAATSFAASAAEPKFYVGGDVGSTKITAEGGVAPSATSYGVFAAYNINETLAVEAGYRRLGKWTGSGGSAELKQAAVSVLVFAPVADHVAVFGRLGYNRISASASSSDFGDFSGHENDAMFGLGVSYEFTKQITGRVEWQRPMSGMHNINVGVAFNF